MGNRIITSMRMPIDLQIALDRIAAKAGHASRSFVVCRLLKTLLECAPEETILRMLTTIDAYGDGYDIYFKQREKIHKY